MVSILSFFNKKRPKTEDAAGRPVSPSRKASTRKPKSSPTGRGRSSTEGAAGGGRRKGANGISASTVAPPRLDIPLPFEARASELEHDFGLEGVVKNPKLNSTERKALDAQRYTPTDLKNAWEWIGPELAARGAETTGIMLPRRWNANKDRQRHLTTLFVLARRPELADKFPSVTSYVPKTDNGDDWKARLVAYARDSDPVDLAEVLKLVLRRLAPQERPIIDPDVYVKFVQSEHAASYPRRAYADMLLPKLSAETGEVLHAVFEVCNSIALYAETNAMTAGRLCHLFGWWLLGEKPDGVTNWSDLYDGYKLAGQRAEHLFYAHLRWQTKQQKMPRRLVQLIINYPFGESSASSEHLPLPPASTFPRKVLHVALGTDSSVPRGSDPERVANEALVAKVDDEVAAPEWEEVSKPDGKAVTLDDILAEGSRAFIEEFLKTKNIDILSPPTSPRLSPEPFDEYGSRRRSQSHGDIPRLGSPSPSSPASPTKLSPGNAGPTGWSDFEKMGFSDTSDNVKGISLSLVQPTASSSTPRPKPKRAVTTTTEPKITYLIAAEEIIELDDAFIQFVEDGQLDLSASSTWPRFALLQLKKPTSSSTAEEPINWVLITVQKRIPRVTAPDDDAFDINSAALDRSVSPGRENSVSRLSSTFGLKDFATNWRSSGMFHSKSSRKSFLGSTRSSRGGDSVRGNESIRSSSNYDGSTNNVSTLPVVNEGDKNKLSTSSEAPTEYTITEMGEMVKVPMPRSSSIPSVGKTGVAAVAGAATVAGAGVAGGAKRLTQVLEDEEPSKLTQTPASDWVYLGEGGAHVVFRYQGEEPELQGRAIRLKKVGAATGPGEVWSHTLLPQVVDPNLMISVTSSRVNEEWTRSVVTPNEMVRDSERRADGTLADLVDYALPAQIMEDLTAPVKGEKVLALEIKPKWGFLPSEKDVKPAEAAAIKSKNCRYCLHQHFRGELDEDAGYCPIDLYSGDETRVRKALAGLWNTWSKTEGKKNNLRVNVDGKAVLPSNAKDIPTNGEGLAKGTFDFVAPLLKSSGVLKQLATLQSTLDVSDVSDLKERFAAEHPGAEPFAADLVSEPTAEELENFVAKYKTSSDSSNWTLREREIAYGLGAIFKDCSIIIRSVLAPEGDGWKLDEAKSSVKLIDMDLKPLKLSHWAQLDDKLWHHWAETKSAAPRSSTSTGQFLAVGGGNGIVRDKTFGPGASELPLERSPSPSASIPDVNSATEELARMTKDDSNANFSPITPTAAVLPTPLQMPTPREVKAVEEAPAVVEPEAVPVTAVVEKPVETKADANDAFADAPGDVAPVDTKGPAPVFTPAPAPPVARSSSRAASTKTPSVKAPSVKAPSVKEKTPVAEPVALPTETKAEEAPAAKAEVPETPAVAAPIESPESDATAKPVDTPTNGSASSDKTTEPTPSVEVTPAAEEKAEEKVPPTPVTPVTPITPVTPTTPTTVIKPTTPSKADSQLATPTQSPVKVARKKSSVFTSLKTKISSKFDDKDKAAKKAAAAAATSPKQAETKKVAEEQPASPTRINKKAAAGAAAGMGTVAAGIAVYENKAKKVAEELKAETERRASREFVRDRSVSVDLARRKSLFEEPALASSTGPSPDTSLSTETAPDEPIATPAGETTDPVIASAEDTHAEPERRNKPADIERTWEGKTEDKEDVPETPKAVPPTFKVPEPLLSPAAADNSPLTPGISEMPSPPALITPVEDSDRGRRSDAPSPTSASTTVPPSIAQSVASSSRDIPVPIATIPMPTTPEIELGTSPLRASPLPKSEDVKRYSLTELPPLPDGTPGSRRVSRVSFDGYAAETASVVSSVDHRGFDTAPDTPQLDQDEFSGAQPQFSRGGMASTSTFGGPHNNMEHLSEEIRRKRVSMNESEAMSEAAWLGSPVHTTKVLPEEPEP